MHADASSELWDSLGFTQRRPLTIRGTPANNTPVTATWLPLTSGTLHWFAPLVGIFAVSVSVRYPYCSTWHVQPPQPTSARRSRKSMSLSLKPCTASSESGKQMETVRIRLWCHVDQGGLQECHAKDSDLAKSRHFFVEICPSTHFWWWMDINGY